MLDVWFWQRIVSPHMAGLAAALAHLGCRVIYVAELRMSAERTAQGWQAPEMSGVDVRYATSAAEISLQVAQGSKKSVHICQGIRANGLIGVAQNELARLGYPFWITMETVDDSGLLGVFKCFIYRWLFWRRRRSLRGVLAIGRETPDWVHSRGVPAEKIFPFAYFLKEAELAVPLGSDALSGDFKFLFAGQLIERKRLDFLLNAIADVAKRFSNFKLQVVGAGPLSEDLQSKFERTIGEKIEWVGQQPMDKVRQIMATADCLVLPSRHDGWGAVVSEALMCGTPAVCSDRCGAAEAVLASCAGGIFPFDDKAALERLLIQQIERGRQRPLARLALASWAQSLGSVAGAKYLLQIFLYEKNAEARPLPPWAQSTT